ncbi:MAG: ligand-binding sensor domain-containing protein [Pseudomonadota bacterium]
MRRQSVPLPLYAILFAVLAVSACSNAEEAASAKPAGQANTAQLPATRDLLRETTAANEPRILETFGVGDDIYVRSLAVEPEKSSIWVGTSIGVHEVDLASRDVRGTFTRKEGLANEYVFDIFVDGKGQKWFGTNGGGASRYKDGKWKTFFPMHGLADYWVYSFGEQKDGTLWIGTWYGVNRVDAGSGEFTTYVKELPNEWVYGIGVDAQDRVWFGTEGGVAMFDGQKWAAWTHNEGLGAPNSEGLPASPNTGLGTRSRHDLTVMVDGKPTYNPNYVFCIHIARDNTVWAGTWGGGVSRFDGTRWTSYTTRDGLAGNVVFSIAQDKEGVFWFGTDRGLTRYDGKNWRTYTRKDGLINDNIYALAATPDGEVWAGSKGGVVRIGYPKERTKAGG